MSLTVIMFMGEFKYLVATSFKQENLNDHYLVLPS